MGFNSDGGCNNATFIVHSVVNYFTKYGSKVYVSILDLSKAFDRINHCQLIIKVISICVPLDYNDA